MIKTSKDVVDYHFAKREQKRSPKNTWKEVEILHWFLCAWLIVSINKLENKKKCKQFVYIQKSGQFTRCYGNSWAVNWALVGKCFETCFWAESVSVWSIDRNRCKQFLMLAKTLKTMSWWHFSQWWTWWWTAKQQQQEIVTEASNWPNSAQ